MREAMGTQSIFKIMLAFTFLFACFLALAISYNRVIKLKNESLAIIEKYEGLTNNSLAIINNYLKANKYTTKGNCDNDEYGVKDLNTMSSGAWTALASIEQAQSNTQYYYCLKGVKVRDNGEDKFVYYNVKLFYAFNLPFFNNLELMKFKIQSETRRLNYYPSINYIALDLTENL